MFSLSNLSKFSVLQSAIFFLNFTSLIKSQQTSFEDAKKYYFGEKSEVKGSDVNINKIEIKKNPKNPKWLNEALDNMMEGVKTL